MPDKSIKEVKDEVSGITIRTTVETRDETFFTPASTTTTVEEVKPTWHGLWDNTEVLSKKTETRR